MFEIQTDQVLALKNVISYRANMNQLEINTCMNEIGKLIQQSNATVNGFVTMATFAVNQDGTMDIEILVPVNKEIELPQGYNFKKEFLLTNAVKIRHKGNPATLQSSADAINKYIADNNLTPITSGYNVTVKQPTSQADIDSMIVDIYVGVSPNIL